jgi:hypothetical protein
MKSATLKTISRHPSVAFPPSENKAVKFLIEKMGITRKEFKELYEKSGVTASQMIELMRYSKYQFVVRDEKQGRCTPCKTAPARLVVSRFA